ncbi:MAG: hypothetical protein Q9225_004458 [Loekoesia sp. 1 TL-2023]
MNILFLLLQCWAYIISIAPTSSNALRLPASKPKTNLLERSADVVPDNSTDSDTHCTTDDKWKDPAFADPMLYPKSCFAALKMARATLIDSMSSTLYDDDFEFFSRSADLPARNLKVQLPWIYTARPQTPQCVLAIAMISSLGTDFILPEQPAGPFGETDVMSLRQLVAGTATLFFECLQRGRRRGSARWDAALGWSQVGRDGNIGIFYMGAHSLMYQRLMRLKPALPSPED